MNQLIQHIIVQDQDELNNNCTVNSTWIAKVVERYARDLDDRDSNPGPGSNFSLEFKL